MSFDIQFIRRYSGWPVMDAFKCPVLPTCESTRGNSSVKDTYGGTNRLFTEFLPRFNIDATLCDTTDHEAIEAAADQGCRLLYLESPTNPTVKVVDIARLAAAGRKAGAIVLKENTFDAVRRLLPRLHYAHAAANLGAVETIVGPPATTSHVECTREERARMGIPESLVRYSTGIEETVDLIADLDQALSLFK